MKKIAFVLSVFGLLAGCWTSSSEDVTPPDSLNIPVTVSAGKSLREAVVEAATRRRWIPAERGGNVIRCTLVQRSHKVEIDILLIDAAHYSIKCVSSNIPVRKYQQWTNNLQREILDRAK